MHKINPDGGNKYFNIAAAYTSDAAAEPGDIGGLSSWKSCSDDICPPNINDTYIAANHGFNCVDKITSTAHNKTELDIGSV
jgi:hypothetical protein